MQSETRTSRAHPSLNPGGRAVRGGEGSAAQHPPLCAPGLTPGSAPPVPVPQDSPLAVPSPPRPRTHPWQCAASTPTSSPTRLSSGGWERCRHTTRSSWPRACSTTSWSRPLVTLSPVTCSARASWVQLPTPSPPGCPCGPCELPAPRPGSRPGSAPKGRTGPGAAPENLLQDRVECSRRAPLTRCHHCPAALTLSVLAWWDAEPSALHPLMSNRRQRRGQRTRWAPTRL